MRIVFFVFIGIVILGALTGCSTEKPYNENSRHKKACACEHEHRGKTLKLKVPDVREEKLLDEILTKIGVSPYPYSLCKTSKIDGLAAFATRKKGQIYIVYNDADFKNSSVLYSQQVLAHEVGHHVNNHYFDNRHSHTTELEAENFSGLMLYKLGYQKSQIIDLYSTYQAATERHPDSNDRLAAILEGWDLAEWESQSKPYSTSK